MGPALKKEKFFEKFCHKLGGSCVILYRKRFPKKGGPPKGNLPLVLAMLAVALVFVGATHGWVPALSQREGSLDLSATFLLGWCIGLSGLTLARRRKPRP